MTFVVTIGSPDAIASVTTTGKPSEEKLKELCLDFAAEDLYGGG